MDRYFQHLYELNKQTYLKLKITRILLVSHDSRMRCFIESVIDPNILKAYRKKDPINSAYLFKNCAILRIRIRKKCQNATIDLLYSGQIDDFNRRDGLYYVEHDSNSISNRDRSFDSIDIDITKLGIEHDEIERDYDVYIMRHGEAEHNLKSNYDDNDTFNIIDTSLTKNGIKQSREAGKYLSKNNIIFDYVFCSVLKRTRQTLDAVRQTIQFPIDKIIIAPCSRETKYGDVRGCFVRDPDPAYYDDIDNIWSLRFNQPSCQYLKSDEGLDLECKSIGGVEIDYSYYKLYHDKKYCSGLPIDVVKIMIDIIEDIAP
jgi:hypothetical protein